MDRSEHLMTLGKGSKVLKRGTKTFFSDTSLNLAARVLCYEVASR